MKVESPFNDIKCSSKVINHGGMKSKKDAIQFRTRDGAPQETGLSNRRVFFCFWSYSSKEYSCQCRRHRTHGFDPWVGKIPWRRKWQPTPVFLPGKFHRGAWRATVHGGHKESDMAEHIHTLLLSGKMQVIT